MGRAARARPALLSHGCLLTPRCLSRAPGRPPAGSRGASGHGRDRDRAHHPAARAPAGLRELPRVHGGTPRGFGRAHRPGARPPARPGVLRRRAGRCDRAGGSAATPGRRHGLRDRRNAHRRGPGSRCTARPTRGRSRTRRRRPDLGAAARTPRRGRNRGPQGPEPGAVRAGRSRGWFAHRGTGSRAAKPLTARCASGPSKRRQCHRQSHVIPARRRVAAASARPVRRHTEISGTAAR